MKFHEPIADWNWLRTLSRETLETDLIEERKSIAFWLRTMKFWGSMGNSLRMLEVAEHLQNRMAKYRVLREALGYR